MKRIGLLTANVCFALWASGCAYHLPNLTPAEQSTTRTGSFDRELNLARLSERHGQLQNAVKIYEAVRENDPSNQLAHHRLGVIAAKRSRFDEAQQHFAEAERAGPTNPDLLTDIGYAYYMQNDSDEAQLRFRTALAIDPQHKRARNNLGILLAERGKTHESFAEFRNAVNEPEAYANLAYVQSQTGRIREATENYHRALELDRNLRPAAEALVQLSAHSEQIKRAEKAPVSAEIADSNPAQKSAPALQNHTGLENHAVVEHHTEPTNDTQPEGEPKPVMMITVAKPLDTQSSVTEPVASKDPVTTVIHPADTVHPVSAYFSDDGQRGSDLIRAGESAPKGTPASTVQSDSAPTPSHSSRRTEPRRLDAIPAN